MNGNHAHDSAASDPLAAPRSSRWSMATAISVVLGLAAAVVMTLAMFWIGHYYRGSPINAHEQGRRTLQELRAAQQQELETFGWVNRAEGVVRIPVDRAMRLLVEAQSQRESPATLSSEQMPAKESP